MTIGHEGVWVTDPDAYRRKLDALLGDRDPIDVMAETPATLANLVSAHPADVLRTRPFEGKWTPCEIIGHLTDTEYVFAYRMRMVLCEEEPLITGMDQEKWVDGQHHNERDPSDLVALFTCLRRFNLVLWRGMSPEDLKRTGRHVERGPESLEMMVRMEAGHDVSHVDQLLRYVAAITGGAGSTA